MFRKIKSTYNEFPQTFWTLIGALFIDRLGGALLFPFFALYITERFEVGMTVVGTIMAYHVTAGIFGNIFGGALADKFGRKNILIIGLLISGTSSLLMGFIPTIETFTFMAVVVGLVGSIGFSAPQAMLTDILDVKKRTQGFGILRVAINLAVTFGPIIGGLLAGINYMLLFVTDFIVSAITAVIVYKCLPETKPEITTESQQQSLLQTIVGYKYVFKDSLFMVFIFLRIISALVYMQMNTTLSVFLRDFHGISPQQYGLILSLNAVMVVLLQFWVTNRTANYQPLIMLAVGEFFYAVGFGLYGVLSSYGGFLIAMIIITFGEMMIVPVVQSLVSTLAPVDKRARYISVFGLSWGIASAIGPLAAGIVIDNYNPNWIWFGGFLLCGGTSLIYLLLHSKVGKKFSEMKYAAENQIE